MRAKIPINIDGDEGEETEDKERGGDGPVAYFCLNQNENDRGGAKRQQPCRTR